MPKLIREEKMHSIADTLYTRYTKLKLLHEGKDGKKQAKLYL